MKLLILTLEVEDVERHPLGWPHVAAFQNVNDGLLIFRSFNQVHCRTLQNLQCEIGYLEEDLQKLDILDQKNPNMQYRLTSGQHQEGWDATKKNMFRELERKLQTYGMLKSHDTLVNRLKMING